MTVAPGASTSAALRLMLVDEDPVFRLGLRIWLEQTAGHRVVAEAATAPEALACLARLGAVPSPDQVTVWTEAWDNSRDQSSGANSGANAVAAELAAALDLVIVDLGLGAGQPEQVPGLRLCGDIKARYPQLPVLVLSAQAEPVLEVAARRLGADGVAARAMAVADLDRLIRRLVSPGEALEPPLSSSPQPPGSDRPPGLRERPSFVPPPRGLKALRLNLRRSSLQQIDAVMAQIEAEQRRGRGSLLDEALLAGRYRELKAARWLVARLWAPSLEDGEGDRRWSSSQPGVDPTAVLRPTPASPSSGPRPDQSGNALAIATADRSLVDQGRRDWAVRSPGMAGPGALTQRDLINRVFDHLANQLQGRIDNTSGVPLEIDILRDDKKRELLFLALRKFEDALDQLRQAEVPPGQLAEKSPLVLHDVWEALITDFFGRYYTLQVNNLELPVVPTLLAETAVVQGAILDRIPLVPLVLGHLLYHEPMLVDGGIYEAATPEAIARSQKLLEHLVIQLANGVVQPLLNHFADVELLKKTLYQRRMMTSRDIERFRNDLSWRYRWEGLVNEPRAIFESQYRLFTFTERGIQTQTIYASRRDELDRLSGLQRAVTLAVETRDAVAPRFRSAVALVGSGIVYVLTDVIGRGIGLIGRGILRGVGGGWRDPRYRRSDPTHPTSQDDNFPD
jgi:DNA-binding NarL/FixJ family response regulator